MFTFWNVQKCKILKKLRYGLSNSCKLGIFYDLIALTRALMGLWIFIT